MSKMDVADFSMERCLLDMPYEMLYGIFRRLPKGKLIEISKLYSKFRNIAGDTRFWKNAYIRYTSVDKLTYQVFDFEELYSEPWPVAVIFLQKVQINPPVSSQTDQIVKVNTLILSLVTADNVTTDAILAKYQCTKLCLGFKRVNNHSYTMEIEPESFSKQTALEELRIKGMRSSESRVEEDSVWVAKVLGHCKNLKTLDLNSLHMYSFDTLHLVKNLPTSLEKLFLERARPQHSFFKLLAKSSPNLRELKLREAELCRCLHKFKFLKVLHYIHPTHEDIRPLYKYLLKFSSLKTVHIAHRFKSSNKKAKLEKVRTKLKRNGIIINIVDVARQNIKYKEGPYPEDHTVWDVSKAL